MSKKWLMDFDIELAEMDSTLHNFSNRTEDLELLELINNAIRAVDELRIEIGQQYIEEIRIG